MKFLERVSQGFRVPLPHSSVVLKVFTEDSVVYVCQAHAPFVMAETKDSGDQRVVDLADPGRC